MLAEVTARASRSLRPSGKLIKENFGTALTVNDMQRHDIKLEMDVRSQELITQFILGRHPDHLILGEEGNANLGGDGDVEWIVDPIDGTVNYFFGIPHFCVSIAARKRGTDTLLLGVIHDPMLDETWQVAEGVPAMLNGKPIKVSERAQMAEAVVTVGFSKTKEYVDAGLKRYQRIAYDVRKTRMLGSVGRVLA